MFSSGYTLRRTIGIQWQYCDWDKSLPSPIVGLYLRKMWQYDWYEVWAQVMKAILMQRVGTWLEVLSRQGFAYDRLLVWNLYKKPTWPKVIMLVWGTGARWLNNNQKRDWCHEKMVWSPGRQPACSYSLHSLFLFGRWLYPTVNHVGLDPPRQPNSNAGI